MLDKYMNYKLCFVYETSEYKDSVKTLYFGELEPEQMNGDDWDDVPYEHNAESPSTEDYSKPSLGVKNGVAVYPPVDIIEIIMVNDFFPEVITPRTNKLNSQYSVKQINSKIVPWISIIDDDKSVHIQAGTTLKDFLDIISKYSKDIQIYLPADKILN